MKAPEMVAKATISGLLLALATKFSSTVPLPISGRNGTPILRLLEQIHS